MIITIDTTKDSQEDIRKAIALLQQIAHGNSNQSNQNYGHNPPVNSAFDFSTPSSSSNGYNQAPVSSQPADNGFAAMFGDMGSSNSSQVQVTSSLSNQPLSNVAATSQTSTAPKKKERFDFETY